MIAGTKYYLRIKSMQKRREFCGKRTLVEAPSTISNHTEWYLINLYWLLYAMKIQYPALLQEDLVATPQQVIRVQCKIIRFTTSRINYALLCLCFGSINMILSRVEWLWILGPLIALAQMGVQFHFVNLINLLIPCVETSCFQCPLQMACFKNTVFFCCRVLVGMAKG